MRVYISGPIKDVPDFKAKFDTAKILLLESGYEVICPSDLVGDHMSYQLYMRIDLLALLSCDTIYMLSGWENSKGATVEHDVASICGLSIFYGSEAPHLPPQIFM